MRKPGKLCNGSANLRGQTVTFILDGRIISGTVVTHIRDGRWRIESARLPKRYQSGGPSWWAPKRITLHESEFQIGACVTSEQTRER